MEIAIVLRVVENQPQTTSMYPKTSVSTKQYNTKKSTSASFIVYQQKSSQRVNLKRSQSKYTHIFYKVLLIKKYEQRFPRFLFRNHTNNKRQAGMYVAQLVDCLPCMLEVLGLILDTLKLRQNDEEPLKRMYPYG